MLRSSSSSFCLLCGLLWLFGSACSYTFDHEAEDIAIVGEPLDTSALLRFPGLRLAEPYESWIPGSGESVPSAHLLSGLDGAPWLAWTKKNKEVHLQRLRAPEVSYTYSADQWRYSAATSTLTVVKTPKQPDQPTQVHFLPIGLAPVSAELPMGDTMIEYDDSLVLSWKVSEQPSDLHVLRRNGSTLNQYSLPWPGPSGRIWKAYSQSLFFYGPSGKWGEFAQGTQVAFLPLGKPPITFPLPDGDNRATVTDNVVASWNAAASTQELHILRLRPDFQLEQHTFPWPGFPSYLRTLNPGAGDDLLQLTVMDGPPGVKEKGAVIDLVNGQFLYDLYPLFLAKDQLVYVSTHGELSTYSTVLRKALPLGPKYGASDLFARLPAESEFIVCNASGVQRVTVTMTTPTPRADARLLTAYPCQGIVRTSRESINFLSGTRSYTVLLDGSADPQPEASFETKPSQSTARILAWCGANRVAHASESIEPENWGATDGWIDDWQFMERGREVTFSSDCSRVRWKEHSARIDHFGELRSAEVPRGNVLRLARNVTWYDGLYDGRLMAAANMTQLGPQNRVLLIDEERREARLLLKGPLWPQTMRPIRTVIPGSDDVLLQVQAEDQGSDLWLVPLPPRLP